MKKTQDHGVRDPHAGNGDARPGGHGAGPYMLAPHAIPTTRAVPHITRPLAIGPAGIDMARPENTDGDRFVRAGNAVAVIPIDGPIWFADPWALLWGGEDMVQLTRAIEAATDDETIQTVVFDIHSPGGSVYGSSGLMAAAARLAQTKRVVALCQDLCCSLAYFLACHAGEVVATPTANLGSIGTIAVIYDTSAAAKQHGVRPVVITDAQLKATGNDGVEITEEMAEALREAYLDNHTFRQTVAQQRGLDEQVIRDWQGKVFHAHAAMDAGLVDRVMLAGDLYAELMDTQTPAKKEQTPETTNPTENSTNTPPPRNTAMAEEETKKTIEEEIAEMDDDKKTEMLAALKDELEPDGDEDEPSGASGDEDDKKKDEPAAVASARIKQVTSLLTEAGVPTARVKALAADAIGRGLSDMKVLAMATKDAYGNGPVEDTNGSADPVGGGRQTTNAPGPGRAPAQIEFNAAVKDAKDAGEKTPVAFVCRNHPELQQAMIKEKNDGLRERRRLNQSA